MEFRDELEQKIRAIDELLEAYLPEETGHQKTICEAVNYSMRAGGKRLRPLLMQEICRLLGGDVQEVKPFMAAIEMIHTSSLIHDDLPCMDDDRFRRGKPSTWAEFGEDIGVLAGDALLIYAVETAAGVFSHTSYPGRAGEAIRILANKTGIYGMIGGQTVDVELAGSPISREKLDFIYALKTGALLEASMLIGAVMAGADEAALGTVEHLASRVGLAFQIRDDILDVTGTEEVLGKPVLSDAKNEKTTYVTLEGLERAREEVEKISEEAIEDLRRLPGTNQFLEDLIRMLITREK